MYEQNFSRLPTAVFYPKEDMSLGILGHGRGRDQGPLEWMDLEPTCVGKTGRGAGRSRFRVYVNGFSTTSFNLHSTCNPTTLLPRYNLTGLEGRPAGQMERWTTFRTTASTI